MGYRLAGALNSLIENKHVAEPEESYARAFIRYTNLELNDIKHTFIKIGFRLSEANENEYYKELGYENIAELAEKEFDFKQTVTYNLMQIWRFAHDADNPMYIDVRFDKYTQSQLLEMSRSKQLKSTKYRLARLIPETATKEEIRRFINKWNRIEINTLSDKELKELLQTGPLLSEGTGTEQETEEEIFHPGGKIDTENVKVSERQKTSPQDFPVLTDGELIDYCLKNVSFFEHLKARIYEKWQQNPTREEFKQFVKDEYGLSGGCSGSKYFKGIDHSRSEGITITRNTGGKIILGWTVVAGKISRLIESGEYITESEIAAYEKRKDEFGVPSVCSEKPEEPEENFSTRVENEGAAMLTPRRQQTMREYLRAVSEEEALTEILLEVMRAYPLRSNDSAVFLSTVRKRLTAWLNAPRENC